MLSPRKGMKRRPHMRKRVIEFLLLAITVQTPSHAQFGGFATEVTQLVNHSQLVMQYIRQGTQLNKELSMYANMLRNSQPLSAQAFGAISNDLIALANIVQGG